MLTGNHNGVPGQTLKSAELADPLLGFMSHPRRIQSPSIHFKRRTPADEVSGRYLRLEQVKRSIFVIQIEAKYYMNEHSVRALRQKNSPVLDAYLCKYLESIEFYFGSVKVCFGSHNPNILTRRIKMD